MINLSYYLILLLCGLCFGAGLALLVRPPLYFDFILKHFQSKRIKIIVVIFSAILAVLFFNYADYSNFPSAMEIFALMTGAGAVIIVFLPHTDYTSLLKWEMKVLAPYGRILGGWYFFFGGILLYAVL